jgi:hypothetical protein
MRPRLPSEHSQLVSMFTKLEKARPDTEYKRLKLNGCQTYEYAYCVYTEL